MLDQAGIQHIREIADQAEDGEISVAFVLSAKKGYQPRAAFLYDDGEPIPAEESFLLIAAGRKMLQALEDSLLGPRWAGIQKLIADKNWNEQHAEQTVTEQQGD